MGKTLDDKNNPDEQDDETEEEEDETTTYSKEQLEQIVRKRTKEIKRSVQNGLLAELGVDSLEDLKSAIEAATKPSSGENKDEGGKTGSEGKVDEAKIRKDIEREMRRDQERKDAERELDQLISETVADRYGISMKAARKIRKMLDDVEADASEDDINDSLDELEEEMPHLFEGMDSGKESKEEERGSERRRPSDGRRGQQTNPGRQPRGPRRKGGDPASAARTLLHERHPHLKNTNT